MSSKPFPPVVSGTEDVDAPSTPMNLAKALFGSKREELVTLFRHPVDPRVLNNKAFPVSYIAIVRRELGISPAPKKAQRTT